MLDFGAQFAGQQRFVEIQVRPDTGLGCANAAGFVTLTPRQVLAPSPNAVFSLAAATADNAMLLNGRSDSFFRDASSINVGTLSAQRLPLGGVSSAHLMNDSASLSLVSGGRLAVSGPRLGIGTAAPTAAFDLVTSNLGGDAFTMRLRTEPADAVRLGLGSGANAPSIGSAASGGSLDLYGFQQDPETPVMIHNEMAGQGSHMGFAVAWPLLLPPPRIGTPAGAGAGGLELIANIGAAGSSVTIANAMPNQGNYLAWGFYLPPPRIGTPAGAGAGGFEVRAASGDVVRFMNDTGSEVRLILGNGTEGVSDPFLSRESNGDLGLHAAAGITLGAVSSLPHIWWTPTGTEAISLTQAGLTVMTAGAFTIDQFSSLPHLRFGASGLNYIGLDQAGQAYTFAFPGGARFTGGNVGIGVASPAAKLHIGGVAGTDGVMFPDGTMQTTASRGGTVTSISAGLGIVLGPNPLTASGTVGIDPAVVPRLTASNTFSLPNTFTHAANSFTGNGAGLTSLNAGSISTGTLADARLSANTALLNAPQSFSAAKSFSAGLSTTAFTMPTGSGDGKVLRSDAGGVGTWQSDGLALPYTGASAAAGDAINVTQTGDGDCAQFNIVNAANTGEAVEGRTNGLGDAVLAVNTGAGRAGFFQITDAANSSDAVHATTNGAGGAVFGESTATSSTGTGVLGTCSSPTGRAVEGLALSTVGVTYAVSGSNASASGRGVSGVATATTGNTYGGFFNSLSTSGRAVYGTAGATSGTPYGVYGSASVLTSGYGVYAAGDMGASGVKSFRIDHPDDPANAYLLHYAAESPEVINFYRGTATLDNGGEAVVELPAYFARVNKTPSYQLTAVGAPMPMLHVAEEIQESALRAGAEAGPGVPAPVCSFRIAGGAPGMKVSWQVQAVRNDRWVRRRGAPVEVQKQGLERGKYQHPELYGQPEETGMNFDSSQARAEPTGAGPG